MDIVNQPIVLGGIVLAVICILGIVLLARANQPRKVARTLLTAIQLGSFDVVQRLSTPEANTAFNQDVHSGKIPAIQSYQVGQVSARPRDGKKVVLVHGNWRSTQETEGLFEIELVQGADKHWLASMIKFAPGHPVS